MIRPSGPALSQQEIRPETATSVATSVTHVQEKDHVIPTGGEGESAIPENNKEETLENLEDDWQHDPVNPRNWSFGKKWVRISPFPPCRNKLLTAITPRLQ
jgi:hypothetical protein